MGDRDAAVGVDTDTRTDTGTGASLPDVAVVTMRGGATPQNATYLLLNVLSELTAVSLVTVALSDSSEIHGEYDVTELSRGAKADSLLGTMFLFVVNQFRMCRAIWRLDAPVVYFFGGGAYVLPVAFAKVTGKTILVQPRGDVPLTLQLEWEESYPDVLARVLAALVRALEFLSYSLADRVVTYTESMAEELGLDRFEEKLYPRGTRYIAVEDGFAPAVPFEERDRRVGMVGRLAVEKGIEELTGAVARLPDDITFRFVGDGDRRAWVESRLADEIDAGRVELAGWVDHGQIPAHLNELRLLVLASEPTEGLPTVIQEAFACGTPVYAPPVSGIPDVVLEGETGFLMTDRDPDRVAADIEGILDREDLAEMSANCREFAVENYSFEASVARFRALLAGLAGT
jgi:glycosyltransferase involved in cell wall biosynthesis